jgi:hypothetical protein
MAFILRMLVEMVGRPTMQEHRPMVWVHIRIGLLACVYAQVEAVSGAWAAAASGRRLCRMRPGQNCRIAVTL